MASIEEIDQIAEQIGTRGSGWYVYDCPHWPGDFETCPQCIAVAVTELDEDAD